MSRGGTRKARARQQAERRVRERKEKAAAGRSKQRKEPRKKTGRGRAALVHLSTVFSPFILSATLLLAGRPSASEPGTGYWLANMVDDPNASYFAEPGGLVYALASLALGGLALIVFPIWLWRRMNRAVEAKDRDRAAVDTAVTMSALLAAVWLLRVVAGFSDLMSQFAFAFLVLSIYVPVFSALLALLMPVVPGSGRIGGILPGFLRLPFTKRFLMTEEERTLVEAAEAEVKRETALRREELARRRAERKRSG